MRTFSKLVALGFAFIVLLSPNALLGANDYPNRPVTIVVAYPAGGGTDVLARIAAEVLQRELGQPFVVQNRPGASGAIGNAYAAKAAPDGYTLLHTPIAFLITPLINKISYYDPLADFQAVSFIALSNYVLVTSPSLNINSVRDLISRAKETPAEITYASSGAGSSHHLFTVLFNRMADIKPLHIPYKGSGPALVDVMAGRVSFFISDFPPAVGLIRQGKLKAMAVTSSTRNKDIPELPTIGETVPGYEAVGWQGLLTRSGTPKSVVSKLNGVLTAYLKRPEAADRMRAIGMDVKYGTPEEFSEFIGSQVQQWKKIIAEAGLTAE